MIERKEKMDEKARILIMDDNISLGEFIFFLRFAQDCRGILRQLAAF